MTEYGSTPTTKPAVTNSVIHHQSSIILASADTQDLTRFDRLPPSYSIHCHQDMTFFVEGRTRYQSWVYEWDQEKEAGPSLRFCLDHDDDRDHLYFMVPLSGSGSTVMTKPSRVLSKALPSPWISSDYVYWLILYRINWLTKQEPKTTQGFIINSGTEEHVDQYRIIIVVVHIECEDEHVCLDRFGGYSDIYAKFFLSLFIVPWSIVLLRLSGKTTCEFT